jgi:hypothetical protein
MTGHRPCSRDRAPRCKAGQRHGETEPDPIIQDGQISWAWDDDIILLTDYRDWEAIDSALVTGVDYSMGKSDAGRGTPILFRLGELHEQLGNNDEAIYSYGRVVERWKNADVILQPKVTEARGRIDALLIQQTREQN